MDVPFWAWVAVLAAIVAIRTFLSLSLELEIEGRGPWQRRGVDGGVIRYCVPGIPGIPGELGIVSPEFR